MLQILIAVIFQAKFKRYSNSTIFGIITATINGKRCIYLNVVRNATRFDLSAYQLESVCKKLNNANNN